MSAGEWWEGSREIRAIKTPRKREARDPIKEIARQNRATLGDGQAEGLFLPVGLEN